MNLKQTPIHKNSKCLKCGLITSVAIGENVPVPGDLVVCSGCSVVAKYNEAFEVVPLTAREINHLKEDKYLWAELSAVVDRVTRVRIKFKNKINGN